MIKQLVLVVLGCTATIVFAAGMGAAATDNGQYCPTEDSCSLDYEGGYWTVRPTVP